MNKLILLLLCVAEFFVRDPMLNIGIGILIAISIFSLAVDS